MTWIHWGIGLLWIFDGFLFFVFPSFVRSLFVRSFREARYLLASAGPAAAAALLFWASAASPHPWTMRLLGFFSLAQAAYLFRAMRTTSPRPIEALVSPSDATYRLWGLALTALGPVVIFLRP